MKMVKRSVLVLIGLFMMLVVFFGSIDMKNGAKAIEKKQINEEQKLLELKKEHMFNIFNKATESSNYSENEEYCVFTIIKSANYALCLYTVLDGRGLNKIRESGMPKSAGGYFEEILGIHYELLLEIFWDVVSGSPVNQIKLTRGKCTVLQQLDGARISSIDVLFGQVQIIGTTTANYYGLPKNFDQSVDFPYVPQTALTLGMTLSIHYTRRFTTGTQVIPFYREF